MTVDVAVVGGGISGLTTAHALRRSGYRVVVLERQARPGGPWHDTCGNKVGL